MRKRSRSVERGSCWSEGEAGSSTSNVVRALYAFCIVVNLPSSEKRRLRREVRRAVAGLPTAYVLEAMAGRLQTPRGLLELETVDGFLIRVGRTRYMSPDRPPAYELGPNPTRLDLLNRLGASYGMERGGKLVVSYTNQAVVDPVIVIDQFNASSLVWPLPRS